MNSSATSVPYVAPTAASWSTRTRRRRRALSFWTTRGACLWDLLGGFIEEGEEPLAALRREIEEETALQIEPGEFLGGYPDRYGDEGIYTLNLYWTAQVSGGEIELDEELAEVGWFGPGELPESSEFAFRNTLEALRDWKAQLGSKPSHK
jgi:8-oxo-dGTP pyrophosphatase MutT (NUDIX family)